MGRSFIWGEGNSVKDMHETKNAARKETSDAEQRRSVRARQRAIGRELRRFYDNVAEEPVPDEFLDLLLQIEKNGQDGEEDSQAS